MSKFLEKLMIFILGIVVCFLGIYYFKDKILNFFSFETSTNGVCYTSCQNKVSITENSISSAVSKIYDAVILIENYKNNKLSATGTGFIYKVDKSFGYILTNYHVVSKTDSLKVIFSNDEETSAKYLGGDEYLDVAVLSIPKDKITKVAEIGKSTDMSLGDTVFTIGTPIDYEYKGTVTKGILSGKDRLVTVNTTLSEYIMKVLQTDAALNPGNSGGPLCNINGEVIGVNSIKISEEEVEGIGFAIAIEDIMGYIDFFEKGKEIQRPYLGISMINVTSNSNLLKVGITIPKNITKGVVVNEVFANNSSSNIFKKGDIITKINGVEVKNSAYLKYELYKYNIGKKITITFIRDNKTITKNIELQEKK